MDKKQDSAYCEVRKNHLVNTSHDFHQRHERFREIFFLKEEEMKNVIIPLCLFLGSVSVYADLDSLVNNAKKFAIDQVAVTKSQVQNDQFARYVGADGKWRCVGKADWPAGFYPGYLWLGYELSGDAKIKGWAEQSTSQIESQKDDKSTHDIGFAINTSFGNGCRLTGNTAYKAVLVTAANSLASRYNANVRAIRSWSWSDYWKINFNIIVDNMMNIELLYCGAKNGGDAILTTEATNHAYRTAQDLIRSDGSTTHIAIYNENTGALIKTQSFYAGLSDASTWACGQAWALYGFTMAYREARKDSLLQSAQKLTDWYLKNLPADHVPYWDFSPQKTGFRDAAAGAVALSGILELCTLVTTDSLRVRYFAEACSIMTSFCGSGYLAKGKNTAGILLHGHGDAGGEEDVSLIYADYFFMQSILRYEAYKKRYSSPVVKPQTPGKQGVKKNGGVPSEGRRNLKGQSLNGIGATPADRLGANGIVIDGNSERARARVVVQ
jgi:unsaturated chondroitin disaccharide hydrolase